MTFEENNANEYVNRQIEFNKDIVKTIDGMNKALRLQSKLNKDMVEELNKNKTMLNAHKNLMTALTIWTLVTTVMISITIITGTG